MGWNSKPVTEPMILVRDEYTPQVWAIYCHLFSVPYSSTDIRVDITKISSFND